MAQTNSTQKGTLYEANGFKLLNKYGLVAGPGPAGGASNIPDLQIILASGGKPAGLELKMSPTSAGGLVMQYIKGKWELGDTGGKEEKIFLEKIANDNNILQIANRKTSPWGKRVPYLQYDSAGNKIYRGNITPKQAYKKDIAQYGASNEIHVNVDPSSVISYYNTKKCYYMNVGTHGFYLLGSKDPLGLNNELNRMKEPLIPNFAFPVHIRCRCQPKGGDSYNFNMVLTMKAAGKSPYNLLPINGTSASISMAEFNKPHNKILLKAFGV
jgi:hypothetical protein